MSAIIDRGRGPEIVGTRITIYDILDYAKHDWHPSSIALWFGLSTEQVRAALDYIEEHREQVMAEYQDILDRCARGNSPAVRARIDANRKKFVETVERIRQASKGRNGNAGNPGGR